MPKKREVDVAAAVKAQNDLRTQIGEGIIKGLLEPGNYGLLGDIRGGLLDWGSQGDYQQTGGDYTQTGGGGHEQTGGGAYNQS